MGVFLPLICFAAFGQTAQHRTGAAAARRRVHRARSESPLRVSAINDPRTSEPIRPGSRGEAVVRAAILLDRIKFSSGQMSRIYTRNLSVAVSAFQSENALPSTGDIDLITWQKLNAAQESGNIRANSPAQDPEAPAEVQPIIKYVIALEDVKGPFSKLPRVTGPNAGERLMLREAKLSQLNYESSLELLGEKFHSSPALLRELNPGKSFDKAGTEIEVPSVLTPDPPPATSVLVDGSTKSVRALDANGKTLAFYPATMGSPHDPLPEGEWKVTEISRYPHFKYNPNLFWDSENKHPRATLPPGPKNPVGVVWIGISKEHYGIHGTPDPAKIGEAYSHGCIRLANWDALELSKIVNVGTPVKIKAAAGS